MELRVKEICKKKGIRMKDLANKLDITRATLTRNIAGNPKLDTLEKIAVGLGVSVHELFPINGNERLYGIVIFNGVTYKIESKEALENLIKIVNTPK